MCTSDDLWQIYNCQKIYHQCQRHLFHALPEIYADRSETDSNFATGLNQADGKFASGVNDSGVSDARGQQ